MCSADQFEEARVSGDKDQRRSFRLQSPELDGYQESQLIECFVFGLLISKLIQDLPIILEVCKTWPFCKVRFN